MEKKRREFIKYMSLLGLGPFIAGRNGYSQDPGPTPAEPDQVKLLSPEDKNTLWRTFTAIDKIWELGGSCNLSKAEFLGILELKTGQPPSYYQEYRRFIANLTQITSEQGEEAALKQVYLQNKDPNQKTFVISEFIHLHLAYGGFKAFGWKNYKGYMGGPFSNRQHPPYRTLEVK